MDIKNLKVNIPKKLRKRIMALSLAGSILALGAGCSKEKYELENIDFNQIIEYYDNEKTITTRDDYIEDNLVELEDEFIAAMEINDKDSANECIYYMGEDIIKALISDSYNIPFDEIKGLEINHERIIQSNEKTAYSNEYPIKFKYNNKSYEILPTKKLARQIAFCTVEARANDLPEGNYDLEKAHQIMKVAMTGNVIGTNERFQIKYRDRVLEYVDENGEVSYYKENDIKKYDGELTIEKDKQAIKDIKKYTKKHTKK